MSKRLSILICGLKSREQLLMNLAKTLRYQGTGDVEILANIDERELPIGAKRNQLLSKAVGDYVCFVDDDDSVHPYYVTYILKAIETNPDCVGIAGIITEHKIGPKKFIHSLEHKDWFEKDGIYYRCPNHLNPIKRDIACSIGFSEVSYQEDKAFSLRVKDVLKTEVFIPEPIYFYYPSHQK